MVKNNHVKEHIPEKQKAETLIYFLIRHNIIEDFAAQELGNYGKLFKL